MKIVITVVGKDRIGIVSDIAMVCKDLNVNIIDILPDFSYKSEYTIQGKVEKSESIFVAKTSDTQTIIQHEEIEDYIWLNFDKAMDTLRFINDRNIIFYCSI